MRYVVFLRGINVGGNKQVPMIELAKVLSANGFKNVKTLLNSGNVVLESNQPDKENLTKQIEDILEKKFGWRIAVILRSMDEIQELIKQDPFENIKVTNNTRLYVTFLAEENKGSLKLPYTYENNKILLANGEEVCWILTIEKPGETGKGMQLIEKEYGKLSTTRNWNTVLKVANL